MVKLSNKATSLLPSLSNCLFTLNKLCIFELRAPKISSCYTISHKASLLTKTCYIGSLWYSLSVIKN